MSNRIFLVIVVILYLGLPCEAQEKVFDTYCAELSLALKNDYKQNMRQVKSLCKKAKWIRYADFSKVEEFIPVYGVYAKKGLREDFLKNVPIDSTASLLNWGKPYFIKTLIRTKDYGFFIENDLKYIRYFKYQSVSCNLLKLYDSVRPEAIVFLFDRYLVFLKNNKLLFYEEEREKLHEVKYNPCEFRDFFPQKEFSWFCFMMQYKPFKLM